jgi:hypothetical protein
MALRIDGSSEYAQVASPWTSGAITIAFWMYRLGGATTARYLCGFIDTDDATPESSGDPRVTVGTASGSLVVGTYVGAGGTTSDVSSATYATGGWTHVAVVFAGSGTTLDSVEVYVDGVATGSPGSASRDLSTNGAFDQLRIGINSASHSNCDFAHFAYYNAALSGSQITELQTKLPNAITGATPAVYESFVGSIGSFTASGATIDSTNDGTLPSLSGGGGASGSISVTTEVIGVSITGEAPVNATVNVTTVETQVSITGSAGSPSDNIRLQPSLYLERGGYAASLTADRWIVFTSDLSAVEDTGTALSINSTGRPTIDITGSASYVVGDQVPLFITVYDEGSDPEDRTVRTFFGWVEAIAQP